MRCLILLHVYYMSFDPALNTVTGTQVIQAENRCTKDGEIVASFLAFLLGFASATVMFLSIAWKRGLL